VQSPFLFFPCFRSAQQPPWMLSFHHLSLSELPEMSPHTPHFRLARHDRDEVAPLCPSQASQHPWPIVATKPGQNPLWPNLTPSSCVASPPTAKSSTALAVLTATRTKSGTIFPFNFPAVWAVPVAEPRAFVFLLCGVILCLTYASVC
jgi:hypothetical protein